MPSTTERVKFKCFVVLQQEVKLISYGIYSYESWVEKQDHIIVFNDHNRMQVATADGKVVAVFQTSQESLDYVDNNNLCASILDA